jgi:hypothetical protein
MNDLTRRAKFPAITISITGGPGNASRVIDAVANAMKRQGIDQYDIDSFLSEAASNDYDDLCRTIKSTVTVI